MDSLLEVGPLVFDAGYALIHQELGDVVAYPWPAVALLNSLNGFINSPMSLGMFLLNHVLP